MESFDLHVHFTIQLEHTVLDRGAHEHIIQTQSHRTVRSGHVHTAHHHRHKIPPVSVRFRSDNALCSESAAVQRTCSRRSTAKARVRVQARPAHVDRTFFIHRFETNAHEAIFETDGNCITS